ncbi:MAG: DUF2200 domain-containing protein [Erysipelotrichaceae bacterium]|nr:DUF2200 domain-containing protein [Erysipelotrichaceae bacterium]
MENDKIFAMEFSKVYPLLVKKVERKNRTQQEINEIIYWLTGYNEQELNQLLKNNIDYKTFFENAPQINPNCHLIKGSICGYKVQDIKDPLMQKIRYLDKLVDELAKGKTMDKILRK